MNRPYRPESLWICTQPDCRYCEMLQCDDVVHLPLNQLTHLLTEKIVDLRNEKAALKEEIRKLKRKLSYWN